MHAKAIEMAAEFDLGKTVLVLTGDEWRRPDLAISPLHDYILPLNFPALPDLPNKDDWEQISLDQLRAWKYTPELPHFVSRISKSLRLLLSDVI